MAKDSLIETIKYIESRGIKLSEIMEFVGKKGLRITDLVDIVVFLKLVPQEPNKSPRFFEEDYLYLYGEPEREKQIRGRGIQRNG